MKNNFVSFTAGEFAKLHKLNKRTLHYYDNIGLFSPLYKGENDYRYYTYEQSMELENILALRELGMSIEEVKKYIQNPSSACFRKIVTDKTDEINKSIERLKTLKLLLQQKEEMLNLSDRVFDGKLEMIDLEEEYLLITPLALVFENNDNLIQNAKGIINHLQAAREICTYKRSCGSFLSLTKIQNGIYDEYDGIFTPVNVKKENLYIKPKGSYIRGFSIGNWNKIPLLYEKILLFADRHHVMLDGYAFETGINEFAVSDINDYVTQIEILCYDT